MTKKRPPNVRDRRPGTTARAVGCRRRESQTSSPVPPRTRVAVTTGLRGDGWASDHARPPRAAGGGTSIGTAEADEVGVVEAEGQRGAEAGQQPEPDDHRGLRPAAQLEVVVDRGHPEDSALED